MTERIKLFCGTCLETDCIAEVLLLPGGQVSVYLIVVSLESHVVVTEVGVAGLEADQSESDPVSIRSITSAISPTSRSRSRYEPYASSALSRRVL